MPESFFFFSKKDFINKETWRRFYLGNFAKFVITPFYRAHLSDCFCRKAAEEIFSKITSLNIKDNCPKRILIESF